jgi:hypothetical protein
MSVALEALRGGCEPNPLATIMTVSMKNLALYRYVFQSPESQND